MKTPKCNTAALAATLLGLAACDHERESEDLELAEAFEADDDAETSSRAANR